MNKKITLSLVCGLGIALTIYFVYWLQPKSQQQQPQQTATTNTLVTTQVNTNDTKAAPQTKKDGLQNLPKSLQNTQVDGEIIIDENQNLVVTRGLRRLYDYFLSALGEETEQQIFTRIQDFITSRTPEPAASDAVALYVKYVAYLKQIDGIQNKYSNLQFEATKQGNLDINVLRQRSYEVQTIRNGYFDSETIQAFFGQEDEQENITFSLLEINQNQHLTREEKLRQQQIFIEELPDSETKQALVTYYEEKVKLQTLLDETQKLKQQGATAEQLFELRSDMYGEEAAERLAVLDQQQADFDARFKQFKAGQQSLLAKYGKDATGHIEKLKNNLFSPQEQKRLKGYEALQKAESK